jgi:PAS domain S-box-containing protein
METKPTEPTPGNPPNRDDPFLEIFRKHDAVMLLIEPDSGRILDANPAAEKFYGYPLAQLTGMSMGAISLISFEQVQARVRRSGGGGLPLVLPHQLAGGEIRTVEAHISPIRLNGRDVLFAVIHDVTERKRMEDALRESEERYRSLFDNMLDGVYRSTHEGRFVEVNPAMVEMFGFSSREEMLEVDIKNELYFAPEERGSHILDTGQRETEVYRMRRKDGSEIWVEDHGHYVHDEQGNIVYHEGLLRDVTERIKAEETLRENEAFLKESQSIAGLGSYAYDFSSGIWKSSDALDAIFGIDDRYDRTVEGWAALVHPDHREEMLRYFNEHVVGARQPFDREYRIVRFNDRAERWVHGLGKLEVDAGGNLLRMKGTIQDITERKRMEYSLRQRLRELEALYNVSASLQTAESIEKTFSILLDQVLAALDTDTGSILLYHPELNELRDVAARGWFREIQNIPVQPGTGIAGTVFSTNQPHVSVEFVRDPLILPSSLDRIPAGWGGACLPIRAGAEMVGVIFVSVRLPRIIAPEQMKLLSSLAEIAGSTLHRTRLFQETARRAEEFESLYETGKALSKPMPLKALLQFIVETAKRLLNANSSGIYLYAPSTQTLDLTVDTHPAITLGTRLQIGEGMAGRVAISRQPMRVDDYSKWEGRSPQLEGIPLRAVVQVPMIYGGELIGILTVSEYGDSERRFTEADERLLSLFASLAAGAIHSTSLRQEALNRLEYLQTLRAIEKAVASSLDLRITLNILLAHVIEGLGMDAATVLLLNPHTQTLQYAAGRGFRSKLIETADVHLNDDFAGRCVMQRRMIQVFDFAALAENIPFTRLWEEEGFQNYIAVPLIVKGEVKGVLEVYRRSQFSPSAEWLEFLETLASQAAIAIDNAQLFDNVQHANMELAIAYEATIEGWSRAMDLRNREAEGHTRRVAELTLRLAAALGAADVELQHMRRGALLHDLGKMGVPDRILFKRGKLTKKELAEIQKHPLIAFEMLSPIRYLRPALEIPYCHHEKWDGTGYPRKLKGEQIPLAARIFAVADVWDDLIHPRPRGKAWSKTKALAYIKSQSGKHFDPRVVQAFLRVAKTL